MSIKTHFRIIIFLVCFIFAFMLLYSSYSYKEGLKIPNILEIHDVLRKNFYEPNYQPEYDISSYCKMLDPNPWNESIKKYIREPRPLSCSKLPLLTFIEQLSNFSNVLKIDKKVMTKYKTKPSHSIQCCYNVITRIEQDIKEYNTSADSLYEISNCTDFVEETLLDNGTEFILVKCQSIPKGLKQGKVVYKDAHAVVPVLPEVVSKLDKKNDTEKLNVIILGIDSVSKLNLRRVMPKTLKYMQQNDWVELNRYNKIGENTFPNLMAILTGDRVEKLENICWKNRSLKMDGCPFIWKEFNKRGYVTLYAEDTPAISTYNLKRTGFVEKPTNYYIRPFMLAVHKELKVKDFNDLPVCTGPVLAVDHIFNYAKRFFKVFKTSNYFTLLWLNSLTHNDVNAPNALDTSVHKFLKELTTIGTYENSLILVLSDHGVRFGDIRETFLGYLEERLPFVFIWCPEWFRQKYPTMFRNLLINQNRLTSPFDIHVTIKKLLYGPEIGKKSKGFLSTACPKCTGLFEPQPLDRSCPDASIDNNWCLCSEFRHISAEASVPIRIGKFLYDYVVNRTNHLISEENVKKSLCAKWKFLRVFRTIEILVPNTKHQYTIKDEKGEELGKYEYLKKNSSSKIYVITIEVHPGKVKFEATVQTNDFVNFNFLEYPKRLDGIYKTSKCVTNLLLKFYCYCTKR